MGVTRNNSPGELIEVIRYPNTGQAVTGELSPNRTYKLYVRLKLYQNIHSKDGCKPPIRPPPPPDRPPQVPENESVTAAVSSTLTVSETHAVECWLTTNTMISASLICTLHHLLTTLCKKFQNCPIFLGLERMSPRILLEDLRYVQ